MDLGQPPEDRPEPAPAPREYFVWNGVRIEKKFAQRPRVLHLETKKYDPRGGGK